MALAFGLRLLVGLGVYLLGLHLDPANPTATLCRLLLGPDGELYHQNAMHVAALLDGRESFFHTTFLDRHLGYPIILGILYHCAGSHHLVGVAVNCLAFWGIGWMAYALARMLDQERTTATFLALLVCFWPPSLAYSSIPLKDPLFLLSVFVFLVSLVWILESQRGIVLAAAPAAALFAGVWFLVVIRPDFDNVITPLAAAAALVALIRDMVKRRWLRFWRPFLAVALILGASQLALVENPVIWITRTYQAPSGQAPADTQPGHEDPAPKATPATSPWTSGRPPRSTNGLQPLSDILGSAWASDARNNTLHPWPQSLNQMLDRRLDYATSGGLTLVPLAHLAPVDWQSFSRITWTALSDLFLYPLPWDQAPARGGPLSWVVAYFELFRLCLIPGILAGAALALYRRPVPAAAVVLWGLALGVSMAVMVMNQGTLYRQRDMVLLPLLVCFWPGLYTRLGRWLAGLLPWPISRRTGLALCLAAGLIAGLAAITLRQAPAEAFLHISTGNNSALQKVLEEDPGQVSALQNGRTPLHLATVMNDLPQVEMLLRAGASLSAEDALGNTPLHLAALLRRDAMVELFLKNGAELNGQNRLGATPLHLAAYRGRPMMVSLLLSKGADITIKDRAGHTPGDLARLRGKNNIADFLDGLPRKGPAVPGVDSPGPRGHNITENGTPAKDGPE